MLKDTILIYSNQINQNDPFYQALVDAIGAVADLKETAKDQVVNDMFFDTCSVDMLEFYENEAGITPSAGQTVEDRRSAVSAKWKSEGKCDIAMLQAVADSWRSGTCTVDFIDGKIQISFIDLIGKPSDDSGLLKALEDVKPAHLPIYYLINYLLVSDISAMTISTLQSQYINEFAF